MAPRSRTNTRGQKLQRTDLSSIQAGTQSSLKMVLAPLVAMSSVGGRPITGEWGTSRLLRSIQKAPCGVNTWHHSSIGCTPGDSTLAGITIRKHIKLSKGEENKNKYIQKKQTREKNPSSKTKEKKQKPRFEVKEEKYSLEEAPGLTSSLRS